MQWASVKAVCEPRNARNDVYVNNYVSVECVWLKKGEMGITLQNHLFPFTSCKRMDTPQASILNTTPAASRPDASSCPYSAFACLREQSERKQASKLGTAWRSVGASILQSAFRRLRMSGIRRSCGVFFVSPLHEQRVIQCFYSTLIFSIVLP